MGDTPLQSGWTCTAPRPTTNKSDDPEGWSSYYDSCSKDEPDSTAAKELWYESLNHGTFSSKLYQDFLFGDRVDLVALGKTAFDDNKIPLSEDVIFGLKGVLDSWVDLAHESTPERFNKRVIKAFRSNDPKDRLIAAIIRRELARNPERSIIVSRVIDGETVTRKIPLVHLIPDEDSTDVRALNVLSQNEDLALAFGSILEAYQNEFQKSFEEVTSLYAGSELDRLDLSGVGRFVASATMELGQGGAAVATASLVTRKVHTVVEAAQKAKTTSTAIKTIAIASRYKTLANAGRLAVAFNPIGFAVFLGTEIAFGIADASINEEPLTRSGKLMKSIAGAFTKGPNKARWEAS